MVSVFGGVGAVGVVVVVVRLELKSGLGLSVMCWDRDAGSAVCCECLVLSGCGMSWSVGGC